MHLCQFVLGACVLLPAIALAQATPSTDEGAAPAISQAEQHANAGPLDSVQQEPLFGSWAPRQQLADQGIALGARWILEPAVNDHGYKGSGVNVVSHINLNAVLDLGKLGIVDNSKVQIVVTDRWGDGTNTARTGGLIQNQAFYGQGKDVRFNEISYEQTFLDKRLSAKLGFYSMGNDFGKLPYTCNFNNTGNCGHPLGPVYSSGWRDDPTGQWGGRMKWTDPAGWYGQAGVYDVNTTRTQQGHGFDLGFHGTRGAIVPVEVGYNHGKTPSDYAGTIRLGAYYDSSRVAELGVPGQTVGGRNGLLVEAAQQIWKPHPDTVRGIAIFGVYTQADRKTGLLPSTTVSIISYDWLTYLRRGMSHGRGTGIRAVSAVFV